MAKATTSSIIVARIGCILTSYGGGIADMTKVSEVEVALRTRRCFGPECNIIFMVCGPCDRGQRYCSEPCRARARRRQRQEANRRYQQTERGRETHRCRQVAYRERRADLRVTDQACRTIAPPRRPTVTHRPVCVICGCQNRWIDPFGLPRHPASSRRVGRKVGARPKNYVFR